MKKVISKVRNGSNGQKILTIPKKCDIKAGDYVKIEKIELEDV